MKVLQFKKKRIVAVIHSFSFVLDFFYFHSNASTVASLSDTICCCCICRVLVGLAPLCFMNCAFDYYLLLLFCVAYCLWCAHRALNSRQCSWRFKQLLHFDYKIYMLAARYSLLHINRVFLFNFFYICRFGVFGAFQANM